MSNRANIYLLNTVKKILKNGIFLGALTRPDEYLSDLAEHFNESGFCSAVFDGDELVIEGRDWVPIVSLRIEQNTLIIVPLEEPRFFQSFMDIIEYVARNAHRPRPKPSDEPKAKKDSEPKKQNDDPDFEWI